MKKKAIVRIRLPTRSVWNSGDNSRIILSESWSPNWSPSADLWRLNEPLLTGN